MISIGAYGPEAELAREMEICARSMSFATAQALAGLGVPCAALAALTGLGHIGRARVELDQNGFWQPIGQSGIPSIILPVFDGALIDLLAFSPRAPDSWALRRGDAWLLGAENIPRCTDWETGARSVRIYADPLAWLIGGAAGICVLRWDRQAAYALAALGHDLTLIADSEALAQYIDQQMRARNPFPSVIFDDDLILEVAA